jgi:DNA-binding response OmpR family regulator
VPRSLSCGLMVTLSVYEKVQAQTDEQARSTILVCDDEDVIRDVVVRYLEHEGMRTLQATDGEQAKQIIEADPPDLVIVDVMMPKVNGLDLCEWIRSKSDVPVILLTARGEESDRITGLELGADDYVVKPFSPRELVVRVKAILRRTGTRQQKTGCRDSADCH